MGTLLPNFKLLDDDKDFFFFSMGKSEFYFWKDDYLITSEPITVYQREFRLAESTDNFQNDTRITIKPDGKLLLVN